MPSKYAHVLPNLAPRPDMESPSRREKIDAAKKALIEQAPESIYKPSVITSLYCQIREKLEAAEEIVKDLEVQETAIIEILTNVYEHEGVSSLTLETGVNIRTQQEPVAVVEDREGFRLWCIANELGSQLALPWQTTNSLLKTYLLEGKPEPTGLRAFRLTKVVRTQKKT